jgi:hypothetical protein
VSAAVEIARPSVSAAAFVRAQRKLASHSGVEDTTGPSYDIQVPVAARPLLRELKRLGSDVIRETLAELLSSKRGGATPDELTSEILEVFKREKAATEYAAQSIGTLEWLSVRKLAGHERLYAAVLSLGLPCGSDSTLFLYRWTGSEVEPVLTAASDDYARSARAAGAPRGVAAGRRRQFTS